MRLHAMWDDTPGPPGLHDPARLSVTPLLLQRFCVSWRIRTSPRSPRTGFHWFQAVMGKFRFCGRRSSTVVRSKATKKGQCEPSVSVDQCIHQRSSNIALTPRHGYLPTRKYQHSAFTRLDQWHLPLISIVEIWMAFNHESRHGLRS